LIPHDADPNAVRVIVTDSDGGPCGHVFLDRIYFPPNSSEIQPHQQAMAKMLAEAIACVTNDGSITKLEVGGHADDKERDPQRISEDRAVTMANYLAKNGVSPKLLKVVGYGKTLPLDKKKTESARAKNRRIEFLILERKPED
jgi:outer membrane protein OmpA-like peptidoglycan-associated protein